MVAIEAPMIKTLQAVSKSLYGVNGLCAHVDARTPGGDEETCHDSTDAMKLEIFGA